MNIKTELSGYINRRMADLLAVQNPDGSFGAYPLSNTQYPFYTMAFAYKKMPGTVWHGSSRLLTALIRCLEYYYNLVDDAGQVEFYGQGGLRWGKSLVGAWPLFCWQEALQLLESDLPEDLLLRHKNKILGIIDRHYLEISGNLRKNPEIYENNASNLYVWRVLMLYRAGVLWQNKSWEMLGASILQRATSLQNEDGWWHEGYPPIGPSVVYNLVTSTAISLYYELSGDQQALAAMEKAACFHDTFSYPDGTLAEPIDGRVRYRPEIMTHIPPSFTRFQEGRAYLQRVLEALANEKTFDLPIIQGFSFLGFVYEHLSDLPFPDIASKAKTKIMPALHSAVIRRAGWCSALCGYENITHMGGFILERQNLLSLWHEKTGLILGGGHSNYQPEFSCFNIIDRKGSLYYLHAKPQIHVRDDEMQLTMTYGGLPVSLSVQIVDKHRAVISYRVPDFTEELFARFMVRANLILAGRPGLPIRCEKINTNLDDKSLLWTEEDFGEGIEHNGWRLRIPQRKLESVAVKWPFYPYNSYRKDRKSELKSAAIIANAQLFPAESSLEYVLEINN